MAEAQQKFSYHCESCGQGFNEGDHDEYGPPEDMDEDVLKEFCPDCMMAHGYQFWVCERGNHNILGESEDIVCSECFADVIADPNT